MDERAAFFDRGGPPPMSSLFGRALLETRKEGRARRANVVPRLAPLVVRGGGVVQRSHGFVLAPLLMPLLLLCKTR